MAKIYSEEEYEAMYGKMMVSLIFNLLLLVIMLLILLGLLWARY